MWIDMMGCDCVIRGKVVVMRHDPAGASIVIMLHSLKMHAMAQAVTDLVDQGSPAFEAATHVLSQLLTAEMAEREVRSIAYHMKVARFLSDKGSVQVQVCCK